MVQISRKFSGINTSGKGRIHSFHVYTAMEEFLTQDAFDKLPTYTGQNSILNWKDLPQNVIFMIVSVSPVPKAKYDSYYLTIIDRSGKQYKVYSPSHMTETIKSHRTPCMRPFFTSLGYSENGKNRSAKFSLKMAKVQKDFEIFTADDAMEISPISN